MSSFSSALSGLLANTTALNVVGDNLANMNTQGFKANNVGFKDEMLQATSSLQTGAGVGSTTTRRNFTQGNIQTTNGKLDVAIQGNGFFVVQGSQGTMYTRDGTFTLNSAGQLVTSDKSLVQGWMAANGVVNPSGATGNITVPLLASQPPVATGNMAVNANLDASAATGATFSAPVQIVDSLGQTHTLTVAFTSAGGGSWSYDVGIPSEDLAGGKPGSLVSLGKGNVTFDASGNLKTPAAPGVVALTNGTALANGAATLKVNWNLYSAAGAGTLTQFAQASASSGTSQDGVQAATVTGISLQDGGMLVASYSNGKQQTIAQVALASVSNPDTLLGVSNNNYVLGAGTSAPSVGSAGTGGRGNVLGGSIEASNVDMATEFTNLIVFQRGYQANSKTISTIQQMDQALMAINP